MNNAVITRAQQGDASAVGTIYETFCGPVHRYLLYRVGNREAAEDLTGEVFVKMMKGLPSYRREDKPFRAWIFQIARNAAIDHFRKMSIRNHVALDEDIASRAKGPEQTAENRLTTDRLRLALKELNEDQRDVIILRFVAEMPTAEVARAIDKSESAVKALQYRALKALRVALGKWKVTYA